MRSPNNKLLPLVNADEVEPFAQSLILGLLNIVEKLTEVAKNPTKPHFNHYIFEVVGLSIKIACTNNPSAVSSFEPLFFPIFTNILIQEVVEFMPYVFQMLSFFLAQYQPVQGGSTMTKPPCIAPLVRLLQAYVRNCCPKIISMGKLKPMLGVFQKLIASRMNDHQGFNLLNLNALWAPLLQALVAVFELPEDESPAGAEHFVEIKEAAGYPHRPKAT
ncbi:hypothetical protein TYRP_004781 [Tyrophagus putrescentiae]|nr:hypothetical protein TYRP_004781 [Tyrophagus putrescentiae]